MTQTDQLPGFCRDCFTPAAPSDKRCRACHMPRVLRHAELNALTIAHLDCDAFYAAVEKRDNPELRDKPVIIGGGRRGVVSTACYIARIRGVGSAQPMFKALKACPEATVIRPNMEKYTKVGREVRDLMRQLTPLVEPLSIDEAFMDLTGTERLHHAPAAITLAKLAKTIEDEIGITVSIGLSHNKFLAKLASDFDKPRGFSIIGVEETKAILAALPVSKIWGVGKAMQKKLAKDGIRSVNQLQVMEKPDLMKRYGSMGSRLYHLSRGEDSRTVDSRGGAKSISSETTFNVDVTDFKELERKLWSQAERVSQRAKKAGLAGHTVVLKLKTARFQILTRNRKLAEPTQLADVMFKAARPLLEREAGGTPFRLLGIGISGLCSEALADPVSLLDPGAAKRADVERAMDKVRSRFGREAVGKGRALKPGGS
ncbi:MAG: DNA polymerase IV [Pseudomonadota bacterium]